MGDCNISESGASNSDRSEEADWHNYFADLSLWWNNRLSKKNPCAPNFKHKITKRALWIKGWYTYDWVKTRLSSID
jgi:hypothetical protein